MGNAYGIDIGTSNFKMCCSDKDKILNEKNIIAIANKTEILYCCTYRCNRSREESFL